jgi:hypothetical protein
MNSEVEKLVKQFADSVRAQNQAIMEANHKLGNKYANKYLDCFRKLSKIGIEGKEALVTLFDHEDLGVRTAAAAFLLNYKTEEALEILREISKGEGLIPFEASEAIKRWEEGNWKLE